MSRLRILAAGAACAALLALPAVARADQETAAAGAVQATLSFDRPDETQVTNMRVTVTRAGVPVLDSSVHDLIPECEEPYCLPGGGINRTSIAVVDLDGDGEPEVIVDGFTGGAHCCVVTSLLRWNGTAYVGGTHDWGDPGYQLRDVTGDALPEFVTADDRFAYAFGSYAESGMPVLVWSYRGGSLENITRHVPAEVKHDARLWKKAYERRKKGRFARGVLAAWVADQYSLGKEKAAHRFLEHELHVGRLRGTPGEPQRAAYVKLLKKRLVKWGY